MATPRGGGFCLVVLVLFTGAQPMIMAGRRRARVKLQLEYVFILIIGLWVLGLVFFECDGDDLVFSEDFQADG